MRANRKSLKLKLLEMAAAGRPRPKSGTAAYDALYRHCRDNHAFRTRLAELRPDWIPAAKDPAAPVKATRNTGAKYRQTLEEMALMGADRPKALTAEGRALYHLCKGDAAFRAWIETHTAWDVRPLKERMVRHEKV